MVSYGVLLSFVKMLLLVAAGGSCMSQVLYLTIDVGVLLGISNLMVLARSDAAQGNACIGTGDSRENCSQLTTKVKSYH